MSSCQGGRNEFVESYKVPKHDMAAQTYLRRGIALKNVRLEAMLNVG